MKPGTDFMTVMADFDLHPDAVLWRAEPPVQIRSLGSTIELTVPFTPYILQNGLEPDRRSGREPELHKLYLEQWDDTVLRLTTAPGPVDSPMLVVTGEQSSASKLEVTERSDGWTISGQNGRLLARIPARRQADTGWSELIEPSHASLEVEFFPGQQGKAVRLSGRDQFFPAKVEALPLAMLEYRAGSDERDWLFGFAADYDEHFAGTGERFAGMDLRGRTLVLENTDGLGVNSRRAYKNVPFFLSSAGYGLFIHTSAHLRLSLADVSTRAAQGRVEEGALDLFLLGGDNPAEVLAAYRRLTGVPPKLPIWSYGVWMSRMTYVSAVEIEEIAARLRAESYPCDVLHIDTGWFTTDWVCEWQFSPERFPDPEGFMRRLREDGFRVSLWQTPNIGEGNCLLEEALQQRYLAPVREDVREGGTTSDFSGQDFGGQIDFTNPEAARWYREKIRKLVKMGAAVIKTDFGEKIHFDADYLGLPAERLHNIYGLLYQREAFEETVEIRGEGEALIWARAGWAGCQRYPVHWGGDAAASWDGMAGTLRGGLHLGLSGFAYWSHDVPGFHGIPEFMNTPPSDELYIRWTQMGVFSSHLRYHGTSSREPWYFPEIAPLIRRWLNFRYALIPYLLEQAEKAIASGRPLLEAMLLRYPEDPFCWQIDDQFFCGEAFLVCPVMRSGGVRDVYLPEGQWVNFWSGERTDGPRLLKGVESPLESLPVFCPVGAEIPLYPVPVQHTGEMDLSRTIRQVINDRFTGYGGV